VAIWLRRRPDELTARPRPARRGMMIAVLPRLAYLTVANLFALLRFLPMSDRDKDTEILALRHQITVVLAENLILPGGSNY
jgi:hypothetical protein